MKVFYTCNITAPFTINVFRNEIALFFSEFAVSVLFSQNFIFSIIMS